MCLATPTMTGERVRSTPEVRSGPVPAEASAAPLAAGRKRLIARSLAPYLAVAAMIVAVGLRDWAGWPPALLLVGPALAAWSIRRRSLLVSLYLAQVAVYFGLSTVLGVVEPPPYLVAVVLMWTIGLLTGALVGGAPARLRPKRWRRVRWPQLVLVLALLAVQGQLVLSARMGIRAQLSGGLSMPTGPLGILATAGPVVTLMLLVTALLTRSRVAVAVALAVVQATILSLSGFRGSAVIFTIAMVTVSALALPPDSVWRRPRRLIGAVGILVVLAVTGFILGANVKDQAATELGQSSRGSQTFGLDQAFPTISERLDLAVPLQVALDHRSDQMAREAVSWRNQAVALVPRFLWPEKPVIDYGRQVAATFFGQQGGRSSSTVTTVGDTLLNVGLPGLILCAVGLGVFLGRAERIARHGVGVPCLAISAGLAQFIVGQESTLILSGVGLVRNVLVAAALWWLSQALHPQRGTGDRSAEPAARSPESTAVPAEWSAESTAVPAERSAESAAVPGDRSAVPGEREGGGGERVAQPG